MTATIGERPDNLFKPGHVPTNKGQRGTHRNARSKLASLVFSDAAAHWDDHGPGALRRLAFHDPAAYVSFIAKLVPQRVEHEVATPFDDVDETLLALSLRLSKAIAFLPAEDRELMDMLLTKGERLADASRNATSQKNFSGELSEEGVGGQSSIKIFGGEGTPLPLYAAPADRLLPAAADPVGESATAAAVLPRDEDVIDADYEE